MSETISPPNPQEAVAATIAMYNRIPGTLGGHFSGFRSLAGIRPALEDMELSHELAGVPLGESNFVEIGPGDGRDAIAAFIPNSHVYTSFGPAEGEQAEARGNVEVAFPGKYSKDELDSMFQVGFAQTADFPEDVDVMHAVNSFTVHTPFAEVPDAFENIGESLRDGGVFHLLTKAAVNNLVEYNEKESFPGAEGMTPRTFYISSVDTLLGAAKKAHLKVVHQDKVEVPTKEWDWLTLAVQR